MCPILILLYGLSFFMEHISFVFLSNGCIGSYISLGN